MSRVLLNIVQFIERNDDRTFILVVEDAKHANATNQALERLVGASNVYSAYTHGVFYSSFLTRNKKHPLIIVTRDNYLRAAWYDADQTYYQLNSDGSSLPPGFYTKYPGGTLLVDFNSNLELIMKGPAV